MLLLSRRPQEDVVIVVGEGDSALRIIVRVVEVRGAMVRLGFDAPPHVNIYRDELLRRIETKGGALTRPAKEV